MAGARSVHLWWDTSSPIEEVKADVAVDESVHGSYFCACGFSGGYMGIQELVPGNGLGLSKIVLFSLWDSGSNKVKVIESGPNVITRRFGGEGVGSQSILSYDWEVGEVCSCKIQSIHTGSSTMYKGWFQGSSGEWMHIATYQVDNGGKLLEGLYSFVEDFHGTSESRQQTRTARYIMECRYPNQFPKVIRQATFTADNKTIVNINAGVKGRWLFLATGGDVHQDVPLNTKITAQE